MLEALARISTYTSEHTYSSFLLDERTQDAVVRNFGILGEAASRIPQSFKSQFPAIPWRKLKGYRNRLIHEYFGIDYRIVWEIIEDDLAPLSSELNAVIIRLSDSEDFSDAESSNVN